jgi:leucyl-tRNA synthetase
MYSYLNKNISNGYSQKTIKENYEKILITMLPIIPHFSLECLEKNNFKIDQIWPSYDENQLLENNIKYVIQINGKKRGLIESERDTTKEKLLENINENEILQKYLQNKKLKKIIFVQNRLINILI